ncbi:SGNH/GDSL hydrolase family protein [Mycetocola zhujimingii]|uniref:SGNH/GDSL hydrolase family protein n=1 Tax=Mycetocola zhujimingii TaxID=2079792 RepID=UPI000D36A36D|nr:SGNH/GDSL hydrolase family protein [Mycetocola zhujimingii]AWB85347.1 SGNH/GDSL hydrolase family protein [Mycetocola zhujimingii]
MPRINQTKRVLLALAFAGIGAGFVACSAADEGLSSPDSGQPVAAFYGDSYTQGAGASDPSLRWSTLIAADRNWTEFNPSVSGLGFVNNRDRLPEDLVGLIVNEKPDIVIVTMGLNDNFAPPTAADDLKQAIEGDLGTFADELPDARLVVVEPFWYTDERPETVGTIIGWVRDAAVGVDADYIEGASRWLEGHPEWMSVDGIHPNDEGYAEIAERMDEELAALGL